MQGPSTVLSSSLPEHHHYYSYTQAQQERSNTANSSFSLSSNTGIFATEINNDNDDQNYDERTQRRNKKVPPKLPPLNEDYDYSSIFSTHTHRQNNKQRRPFSELKFTGNHVESIEELRLNLPIIRRNARKFNDPEKNKKIHRQEKDVFDADMENWLLITKRFPFGKRWSRKEKRTLRKLFDIIDDDHSGEVDVDELADPLLSSGIARTMGQVRALVKSVDEDNSGSIGFDEFLSIMRPKQQHHHLMKNSQQMMKLKYAQLQKRKEEERKKRVSTFFPPVNNIASGGKQQNGESRDKESQNKMNNKFAFAVKATIEQNNEKKLTRESIRKRRNTMRKNNQPVTKTETISQNNVINTTSNNNTSSQSPPKISETTMHSNSNNPIAKLQLIQQQNGNMGIKSVLTVKRRKLLLDATMCEAQRREISLGELQLWKTQLKDLTGMAKFKKLYEIQQMIKSLQKNQNEKQHFVSAMQGIISREKGEEISLNVEGEEFKIIKDRRRSSLLSLPDIHELQDLQKQKRRQDHQNNLVNIMNSQKEKQERMGHRLAFLYHSRSSQIQTNNTMRASIQ